MRLRHKLIVLLIVVGLATISALMMITRVELMGWSIQESFVESAYAYTLSPSNFVLEFVQHNQSIGAMLAGLFSLVQYVFHGIYEFGLLFNNFHGEHSMGSLTLWLPIKLISMFTGGWISVGPFDNGGGRGGIFTTFVGPVYVDFGWLSPIALIVYGGFLGLPFRLLQIGRVEWLPAVAIIATCALLWPVVNILSSASGTYLLVAAVAFGLMGKRLSGK